MNQEWMICIPPEVSFSDLQLRIKNGRFTYAIEPINATLAASGIDYNPSEDADLIAILALYKEHMHSGGDVCEVAELLWNVMNAFSENLEFGERQEMAIN